jgi:protease-4
MVACGADRIIANSSSLTGSIGVIMQYHTYPELLEKIGVGTETIKSGDLKDVGNYAREMTDEERLMLRSVVMDAYEQFVQIIADGRDMSTDEIYPLADGSIFTGLQAYNLGLVDTLGGLKEAIDMAADLAGIEGEPEVVRPYHRSERGIWDLVGSVFGDFETKLNEITSGPRLLYLYQ